MYVFVYLCVYINTGALINEAVGKEEGVKAKGFHCELAKNSEVNYFRWQKFIKI